MKLDGIPFQNSDTCKGISFAVSDAPLDIATIIISGRYPETGWAMNDECHEMVVISRGHGRLLLRDGLETVLAAGDAVTVEPKQWFAWDGDMDIVMACQPAFNSGQYNVEEEI